MEVSIEDRVGSRAVVTLLKSIDPDFPVELTSVFHGGLTGVVVHVKARAADLSFDRTECFFKWPGFRVEIYEIKAIENSDLNGVQLCAACFFEGLKFKLRCSKKRSIVSVGPAVVAASECTVGAALWLRDEWGSSVEAIIVKGSDFEVVP